MRLNRASKLTTLVLLIAAFTGIGIYLWNSYQNSKKDKDSDPATSSKTDLQFRIKWLIYSSFAPHFVALEKGYYSKEGLNVSIEPGGPGIDPLKLVLAGE